MSIYLDNAATSHPKPEAVIRAVTEAMTVVNANPGRSGHAAALAAARIVLDTRDARYVINVESQAATRSLASSLAAVINR